MKDKFSELIREYRYNNNLSQNDLVDILSINDDFLSKIDAVTLSRWENKKTIPSIEKKIRVMKKIDLLVKYLHSIHEYNRKTKLDKSMEIRFGMEINKYKELNNLENLENTTFDFFNDKKKLHKNIRNYLIKQDKGYCNICKDWPTNIGCWCSDGKIEAFFVHLFINNNACNQGHLEDWSQLYKKGSDENINSIVLLEQVTATKTFYKLCLLSLFDSLINNNHLEYLFIHVYTDFYLKLALSMGFQAITTIKEPLTSSNEFMDLKFTCVLQINIVKLLANKDYLFFCLKSYHDLKAHDPTLLERIYKTSHNQTKKAPALGTEQGL